ncbi:cytochrome d ubiquinol oxidase subunit II [Mycoavidus cysteinexigens]|nr:cytochrome d ubiquinol oxidase subunit II [Mycoavidus cysteinexigens]GAM53281.1 putative Cytochrome bd2, subunit II [bacterium endosymbiont of Mortierella elongata FMR23-6]
MGIDLPLLWAVIILFGVMMYVIMDGFDLGIGILYPFFKKKEDRDVMMNTVAPVWDGNETWLVLGGAGLMAAFPIAYAAVLSAFYLPLVFMLVGLIFRGVAFEFRFKATEHQQHFWDKAFIGGSIAATFFQGVTLGAFIHGIDAIDIHTGAYIGNDILHWLTPFSVFTGLGLVVAYALLGSTWLIMKTDGELQQRMRILTRPLAWILLAVIAVISLWTPLAHEAIAHRWFSLPNLFYFLPVPLLVALTMYHLLRTTKYAHAAPFLLTLALIFLGYSGLGISVWPNIVPPHITIWQASSPSQSQGFALIGVLLILPVILLYTAWSYYVFRGKTRHGEEYH